MKDLSIILPLYQYDNIDILQGVLTLSISIAIYSRKSKFTGKGESIENQIELCRQYIERHFLSEGPVDILVYEDEGFSGKNTARPQFKRMLQDAKKRKFSVLICYRLDRISRNVGDFAIMIEDLHLMGIDFVSIRESFDTSSPMGRAMMYIASVFAQLERETIAERIRDNMYELSKTGRWLGGTTPTGYSSISMEKVTVEGKIHKAYALKLIPEEAQVVLLIYDKFLETGSLTQTEVYLTQNNYRTKNNKYFSRFSIKSILANPVYMIADAEAYQFILDKNMDLFSEEKDFDGKRGIMAYNKTLQREGKAHKARDIKEWVVTVGKHEGIISGYQWVMVQKRLEQNKSKAYKKPRSNVALLSGLLVCGECGNYMRPKLTRQRLQTGERSYDYLCLLKEKSNGKCCSMVNPKGNLIDYEISQMLGNLQQDSETFLDQLEQHKRILLDEKKVQNAEIEQVKKLIQENEKERNVLVNTLAKCSESSAEQYIIKRIEEYHEKGLKLKDQLEQLQFHSAKGELSMEDYHELAKKVMSFSYSFHQASIEKKRHVVSSIVSRVVWEKSQLHIYLTKSEPLCEDSK